MKQKKNILALYLYFLVFILMYSMAGPRPCPAQIFYYPRIEEADGSPSGVVSKFIFPAGSLSASGTYWTIGRTPSIVDDPGNNAHLTAAQCNGATIITNDGAGASRTYKLPTPAAGLVCRVYLEEAHDVDIDPNVTTEWIYVLTNSAGDKISSDAAQGSNITLIAHDATGWWPWGWVGSWADAN